MTLTSEQIEMLFDQLLMSTAVSKVELEALCNLAHKGLEANPDADGGYADMERRKDAAYLERNQVVAALAKCFPSGIAKTAIEGWSDDWHGCVYIDTPNGQVSWHFHDSHAYLFEGLPPYSGSWDGHSTEEKYKRLAGLSPAPASKPDKFDIGEFVSDETKAAIAAIDDNIRNARANGNMIVGAPASKGP